MFILFDLRLLFFIMSEVFEEGKNHAVMLFVASTPGTYILSPLAVINNKS